MKPRANCIQRSQVLVAAVGSEPAKRLSPDRSVHPVAVARAYRLIRSYPQAHSGRPQHGLPRTEAEKIRSTNNTSELRLSDTTVPSALRDTFRPCRCVVEEWPTIHSGGQKSGNEASRAEPINFRVNDRGSWKRPRIAGSRRPGFGVVSASSTSKDKTRNL